METRFVNQTDLAEMGQPLFVFTQFKGERYMRVTPAEGQVEARQIKLRHLACGRKVEYQVIATPDVMDGGEPFLLEVA